MNGSSSSLMVSGKLPMIPVQMHPLVGEGIVESRLILHRNYPNIETAIADYRNEHAPERAPHRRVYFMEGMRDRAKIRVRYLWGTEPRRTRVIGITKNCSEAVRILIGNNLSGCWMGSGIRWELYEDPECDNLLDMGRLDQWDLLRNITPDHLEDLSVAGVVPTGDWDFDGFLWKSKCSVCGSVISLNAYFFSIDSAVCSQCGNRPYLAPSIHRMLDCVLTGDEQQMTLRALRWLSGVGAVFQEVRRDLSDEGGQRLRRLAERSLIWKATTSSEGSDVKALIERRTGLSFDMYQSACGKLRRALCGEESFGEEHRILAQFVFQTTELLRSRLLSTPSQ